jgi:MFS family permease
MDDLSNMIVSATSAAYIAGLLVNGFTLAKPDRPSWMAFGLALVIAVLATGLLALATLPPDYGLTRQDYAQIFIVGIFAAGGAAGGSVTQSSATAKREQATKQTEPDPLTAQPSPERTP